MNRIHRIAAAVLAIITILGLSACSSSTSALGGSTKIEKIAETCEMTGNVADEGHTIAFDTEGEEDSSGDAIEDVACVLAGLDIPASVVERIDNTRALDGMQDAEWDGYSAQWNYHPDNGMWMIVTN
jgi:hypothetical protein